MLDNSGGCLFFPLLFIFFLLFKSTHYLMRKAAVLIMNLVSIESSYLKNL